MPLWLLRARGGHCMGWAGGEGTESLREREKKKRQEIQIQTELTYLDVALAVLEICNYVGTLFMAETLENWPSIFFCESIWFSFFKDSQLGELVL